MNTKLLGITMGDASGVGPEILLKAAKENLIPAPYVVFGDLAPLRKLNENLGLPLAAIRSTVEWQPDRGRESVVPAA